MSSRGEELAFLLVTEDEGEVEEEAQPRNNKKSDKQVAILIMWAGTSPLTPTKGLEKAEIDDMLPSVGTGLAPSERYVGGTLRSILCARATISRTGASPVPTISFHNDS